MLCNPLFITLIICKVQAILLDANTNNSIGISSYFDCSSNPILLDGISDSGGTPSFPLNLGTFNATSELGTRWGEGGRVRRPGGKTNENFLPVLGDQGSFALKVA